MFSKELPRIYELRHVIQTHKFLTEHFRDFDNSLRNDSSKMWAFRCLEKELQGIDSASWGVLKCEIVRQKKITWTQLMDKMNEVRGYNYLARLGCKNIQFIPPSTKSGKKTPDLQGILGSVKVLCEVKTIHISKEEIEFREGNTVRTTTRYQLKEGFFKKFRDDLSEAEMQLIEYDTSIKIKYIAYVIINFDDWIGDGREDYFHQIQQFLFTKPVSKIDIECHAKTALGEMRITDNNL